MIHTLRQIFRSGKFVSGFVIFATIILITIIYPLIIKDGPLTIICQGTFFPPGIYVSVNDSLTAPRVTLNLEGADKKRLSSKISAESRKSMQEWLIAAGVPQSEVDQADTAKLLELWTNNYDSKKSIPGMTNAKRNAFIRLNTSLKSLLIQPKRPLRRRTRRPKR